MKEIHVYRIHRKSLIFNVIKHEISLQCIFTVGVKETVFFTLWMALTLAFTYFKNMQGTILENWIHFSISVFVVEYPSSLSNSEHLALLMLTLADHK